MDTFCFILNNNEKFESNVDSQYESIEEWKQKWNPNKFIDKNGKTREFGYVTYKVLNGSRSFPNDNFEETALIVALREWGLRTQSIRFKRERDPNKKADIILQFKRSANDQFFKDRPSVLAYAYFPTNNEVGGDITFNDDYLWSANGKGMSGKKAKELGLVDPRTSDNVEIRTYNIIHTLIHESGHAIGLVHNESCNECVMFPYYNGRVALHDNDVERIQKFYGKRALSSITIDYFKRRLLGRYS